MTIDLSRVGEPLFPASRRWDERDTMLYALGVGAAELRYATDNSEGVELVAIPTAVVTLRGRLLEVLPALGEIDPATVLHAEEQVELHQPLPTRGEAQTVTTIRTVYDKDPHALAVVDTAATLDGALLFTTSSTVMLRGAGGFGGERGPSSNIIIPEKEPDVVVDSPTRPDQALLYRLTGDRNPLHSDPRRAERAGFPRPILHGLCTLGIACVALIPSTVGDDPGAIGVIRARFSSPVFPGERLRTEVWTADGAPAVFRTWAGEGADRRVVLDRGTVTPRLT